MADRTCNYCRWAKHCEWCGWWLTLSIKNWSVWEGFIVDQNVFSALVSNHLFFLRLLSVQCVCAAFILMNYDGNFAAFTQKQCHWILCYAILGWFSGNCFHPWISFEIKKSVNLFESGYLTITSSVYFCDSQFLKKDTGFLLPLPPVRIRKHWNTVHLLLGGLYFGERRCHACSSTHTLPVSSWKQSDN